MTTVACPDCGAPLEESALSCLSCHCLTHAAELESLAAQAQQAMVRGDLAAARALWERSLALLPPDSVQYRSIRAHIENLKTAPQTGSAWKKGAAGIGPALLLLFTKGKLLLLGLTKLSTLLSMSPSPEFIGRSTDGSSPSAWSFRFTSMRWGMC